MAGQRHEISAFKDLVDAVSIKQIRGAPRKRPDALAGDKGYSFPVVREWLRKNRVEDVVPTRENQERDPKFNKRKYRKRNIVERCIGWLKESRRIATRFEKLAVHFLGMLHLEIIMTYLGEFSNRA